MLVKRIHNSPKHETLIGVTLQSENEAGVIARAADDEIRAAAGTTRPRANARNATRQRQAPETSVNADEVMETIRAIGALASLLVKSYPNEREYYLDDDADDDCEEDGDTPTADLTDLGLKIEHKEPGAKRAIEVVLDIENA